LNVGDKVRKYRSVWSDGATHARGRSCS